MEGSSLALYEILYLGFPGEAAITVAAWSKTRTAHINSKMSCGFESHSRHWRTLLSCVALPLCRKVVHLAVGRSNASKCLPNV